MRRAVDVVVIGAGMAGLTSVSDLLAHWAGTQEAPQHARQMRHTTSTASGLKPAPPRAG